MAFIRLRVDLGPCRQLQSRNPKMIAKSLYDLPVLERGPLLLPALLHSVNQLDVPVKLGIEYVCRNHSLFSTVQHSLAGLECAVFLSKWLLSVAKTAHVAPLERKYNDLLQR